MERVALITGGGKGIGKACAIAFAQAGYQVAVHYHTSEDEAKELAQALNGIAVRADISKKHEVEAMVREVEKRYHRIDALVLNAGIAKQKLFIDTTDEDWREIFSINLDGAFYCSKAALPGMLRRKDGSIIFMSSIWGETGASMEVAYSASKAALIGMTKALAKEVGPSGIRVNCIAPGVINTQMNGSLGEETIEKLKRDTPLRMIGEPMDVAATAVFLSSQKARFFTGQVFSPNGGLFI